MAPQPPKKPASGKAIAPKNGVQKPSPAKGRKSGSYAHEAGDVIFDHAMPGDPGADEAKDYSCIAVLRLGEHGKTVPEYQADPDNQIWTQIHHENPAIGIDSTASQITKWRQCGYPPGIAFMHTFNPEAKNPGILSRYTGFFDRRTMVVFADNIVCDICRVAILFFTRKNQTTRDISTFIKESKDTSIMAEESYSPQRMLDHIFIRCVKKCYSAFETVEDPSTFTSAGNAAIITKVFRNETLRQILVDIVEGCKRPTFIPIPTTMVKTNPANDDTLRIDPEATIDPSAEYTRAGGTRFPTPANNWNDGSAFIGKFTLEDVNRAICLFLYAASRRKSRAELLAQRAPTVTVENGYNGYRTAVLDQETLELPTNNTDTAANLLSRIEIDAFLKNQDLGDIQAFRDQQLLDARDDAIGKQSTIDVETRLAGQHEAEKYRVASIDVETRIDFHASIIQAGGSARPNQSTSNFFKQYNVGNIEALNEETLDKVITKAERHHRIANIDQVTLAAKELRLKFQHVCDEEELRDYIDQAKKTPAISALLERLADFPEKQAEMVDLMERGFLLDRFFNGHQDTQQHPINEFCDLYGVGNWPNLTIYPENTESQSLLPHQLLNAHEIYRSFESAQRSQFLGDEMGLGKTIACGATLLFRNRQQKKVYSTKHDQWLKAKDISNGTGPSSSGEPSPTFPSNKDCEKLEFPVFKPSLILVPVNVIGNFYQELRRFFPDIHIVVYFGVQSSFPVSGADVVSKRQFNARMKRYWDKRFELQTGLTVVLSSYHTFYRRAIFRKSELFIWKPGYGPSSTKNTPKKPNATRENPRDLEGDAQMEDPKSSDTDKPNKGKLRAFDKSSIPEDDIILTKDPKHADGYLSSYSFRRPLEESPKFASVILNEAHTARNRESCFFHTVRLLDKENLLWITGTVLYSSLQDLVSPLMLMWDIIDIDWDFKSMDIDGLSGLYHPDYDPYIQTNNLAKGLYTVSTPGIFHDMDTTDRALVKMKQAYDTDGRRLWLMCPGLYENLGHSMKWDIEFAHNICGQVLAAFQIRRTISSCIMLPDGGRYYPGAAIPPCEMITEELVFSKRDTLLVESKCNSIIDNLFLTGPAGDISHHPGPSSSQASLQGQAGPRLNFGSHRKGVLYSHDARNIKLLSDKSAADIPGSSENVRKAISALLSQPLTQQQAERQRKEEQKRKDPIVGIDQVRALALNDPLGGLSYFFRKTTSDPDVPCPKDRASYISWYLSTNPLMTRVFRLLYRYVVKEKTRVLIFCDIPWIQQLVSSAIAFAGFEVATVRSIDPPKMRQKLIEEFNSKDTPLRVFVANIQTLACGVSLHSQCHKGIFITYTWSPKHQLHCLKRIHRIMQKNIVHWHILKVKNTYQDYQERGLCEKWAKQAASDAAVPDWCPPILREMLIFEAIRSFWNQPFNRFAWVILRDINPSTSFDYNSEEVSILGHLVSLVCRVIILCDDDEAQKEWIVKNLRELTESLIYMTKIHTRSELETILKMDWFESIHEILPSLMVQLEKVAEDARNDEKLSNRLDEQMIKAARRFTDVDDEDNDDDDEDVEKDEDDEDD